MKIKAKKASVKAMKLCVPIDGVIDIDHNGIADVSPKCAAHLVSGTSDWDYIRKAVETAEEEAEDENGDGELSEREQFEAGLKTVSLAEMKDMAADANLDPEEYESITTKKLMIAYMLNKFDSNSFKGNEELAVEEVEEKASEESENDDEEEDEE